MGSVAKRNGGQMRCRRRSGRAVKVVVKEVSSTWTTRTDSGKMCCSGSDPQREGASAECACSVNRPPRPQSRQRRKPKESQKGRGARVHAKTRLSTRSKLTRAKLVARADFISYKGHTGTYTVPSSLSPRRTDCIFSSTYQASFIRRRQRLALLNLHRKNVTVTSATSGQLHFSVFIVDSPYLVLHQFTVSHDKAQFARLITAGPPGYADAGRRVSVKLARCCCFISADCFGQWQM